MKIQGVCSCARVAIRPRRPGVCRRADRFRAHATAATLLRRLPQSAKSSPEGPERSRQPARKGASRCAVAREVLAALPEWLSEAHIRLHGRRRSACPAAGEEPTGARARAGSEGRPLGSASLSWSFFFSCGRTAPGVRILVVVVSFVTLSSSPPLVVAALGMLQGSKVFRRVIIEPPLAAGLLYYAPRTGKTYVQAGPPSHFCTVVGVRPFAICSSRVRFIVARPPPVPPPSFLFSPAHCRRGAFAAAAAPHTVLPTSDGT